MGELCIPLALQLAARAPRQWNSQGGTLSSESDGSLWQGSYPGNPDSFYLGLILSFHVSCHGSVSYHCALGNASTKVTCTGHNYFLIPKLLGCLFPCHVFLLLSGVAGRRGGQLNDSLHGPSLPLCAGPAALCCRGGRRGCRRTNEEREGGQPLALISSLQLPSPCAVPSTPQPALSVPHLILSPRGRPGCKSPTQHNVPSRGSLHSFLPLLNPFPELCECPERSEWQACS